MTTPIRDAMKGFGSDVGPLGDRHGKSTFRHRVSVAPWDEWNFHAFVRSDDGTVEHYWPGDATMFGPEELGGHFDTDPVAAWRFSATGSELHLIGRSGSQLVDWMWGRAPRPGGWLGQPTVLTLPGLAVAEPGVISVARDSRVRSEHRRPDAALVLLLARGGLVGSRGDDR
jgi:hypothetical protein